MGRINHNYILRDTGLSNYEDTTEFPRHRWYYYKEGFSPKLVEKAIEEVGVRQNDIILDPFNGSGTTTLTSSLNGYQSIGIEVNPFTSFLSEAKLKNVDTLELDKWTGRLLRSSEKTSPSPLLRYSTFSKKKNLDKWLFNDSILNSFEGGWKLTDEIPSYNVKKILKLALIISAMQNCNAKRDGKCLRYRENWSENTFNKSSFLWSLTENIATIHDDIMENPVRGNSQIINGDCRKLLATDAIPSFKLCITSPPYLNTFDYTDIYRPELFLGKFISTSQSLYNLRLRTVRSHIQAKWKEPTQTDFGALYNQTMEHLNDNKDKLMHKNIPMMAQAYFEDISNILNALKRKATRNGQVWFIVSNSAYADREIPVDLIIGDIASRLGWYLKEIGVLRYLKKRKTNYSKNISELRESVIILSKNKF